MMEDKNEIKYKRKYKSLKVQLQEAEQIAEELTKKQAKYDKRLQQLKFEKSILLEKLTELREGSGPDSEISSEEEPIEKSRRPEKDPNAPKRPANAFLMFCQLERTRLKEENADASVSDVTKLLGIRWKELTDEEKQKYYRMYDTDKIRYEKEMSSYAPGTKAIEVEENQEIYENEEIDNNQEQSNESEYSD